jgi:hypothetical protein
MSESVPPLPPQSDTDFWQGRNYIGRPQPIDICATHTKNNWMTHKGYRDNHDGTISCVYCPWGTKVPGYLKIKDECVVDLRA